LLQQTFFDKVSSNQIKKALHLQSTNTEVDTQRKKPRRIHYSYRQQRGKGKAEPIG
jgi:hypothetical protein